MKIFLIISAIIVVGLVVFYFVYEKRKLPGYSNSEVDAVINKINSGKVLTNDEQKISASLATQGRR